MIVGSGLIAQAFQSHARRLADICIYAAGVSNSACTDDREFQRERERLEHALHASSQAELFVYFSTCSVDDPSANESPYVVHKRHMEAIVSAQPRHLVVRLPQIAGRTPNPHTLLNYFYARIVRSERFDLWKNASRNVIDVDDVADLVCDLVLRERVVSETINVANPIGSTLPDIVAAMEQVTRRRAIYTSVDSGSRYDIDVSRIAPSIERCTIDFSNDYLLRTLKKYYG